MKKRQWIWAIAFGAMLAITGCGGDDDNSGTGGTGNNSGTGGTGNTGNSAGDSFCETLCTACDDIGADDVAQCTQACDAQFESLVGLDLDACPNELNTVTNCIGASNDCDLDMCENEFIGWATCVATSSF